MTEDDEAAVIACADLVGRTGFTCGYLRDGVPPEEAGWYAYAQYRGARITIEDVSSPVAACAHLAARLLDGGTCQHCGRITTTSPPGTGKCLWRRDGRRWERGCG